MYMIMHRFVSCLLFGFLSFLHEYTTFGVAMLCGVHVCACFSQHLHLQPPLDLCIELQQPINLGPDLSCVWKVYAFLFQLTCPCLDPLYNLIHFNSNPAHPDWSERGVMGTMVPQLQQGALGTAKCARYSKGSCQEQQGSCQEQRGACQEQQGACQNCKMCQIHIDILSEFTVINGLYFIHPSCCLPSYHHGGPVTMAVVMQPCSHHGFL